MRTFRAINTGTTILDRMLQDIESALNSLARAVTNDRIVTVAIGTSDTVVTHGLGHPPVSMDIVDQDANAVIWRSSTVNSRAAQTIILVASAPVNVKLRFM